MNRLRWLVPGLLAGACSALAQVPVVSLHDRQSRYTLGPQVDYLEDSTRTLTLAQALRSPNFRRSRAETPSFGYSPSVFWFRTQLRNEGTDPERRYLLELGYSPFRHVDLFVLDERTHLLTQTLAGNARGAAHRPLPTPHYVFPLRILPGQVRTVYLRADGMASKIFPLNVYEQQAFYRESTDFALWLGFYFGFLGIIAVYHLIFFFYTRDPGYLFFSLYLVSFGWCELLRGNGNFAERFVLVYHPYWQQQYLTLLNGILALGSVFVLRFYRLGLKVPEGTLLGRLLTGVWVGNVLLFALLTLLGVPNWVLLAFNFFVPLVLYLSLLGTSAWRMAQGYRPSVYYLLGTGVFLGGVVLVLLNRLGWLPGTYFFVHNAVQLGSVGEIMLLSLGFAESLRQERKRKKIDLLRSHLGGRKEEREWLSVVLHNLFGNTITYLRGKLGTLREARFTPTERNVFEEMTQRLDEADRELRTLARSLLPEVLDRQGLRAALEESVANFNSLKATRIQFSSTGEERRLEERMEFELYLVGLELLNNVVRHAAASAAWLELVWEPTTLHLLMRDNGRGFDSRTRREGHGFGSTRQLVVRKLRGTFGVESVPGVGTTVRIRVPHAHLVGESVADEVPLPELPVRYSPFR